MRWQVEVSSIGKDGFDPYTVEADSWQRALQAARKLRGDESPMSGFSIELLTDGCRAVDPAARIRYEVKRAKDDAPLSPGAEGLVPAPKKAAPRPVESKPAVPVAAPAAAPAPAPAPAPAAPKDDGFPTAQVLSKREEDPTDSNPLSYREYTFLVAKGTSEDAAAQTLLVQFLRVRKALESANPGKLVNLAAFDEPFSGRPTVPPIATLTWKDWRGEPVVAFPRRDGRVEEMPTQVTAPPQPERTQPIQAPQAFPEPPPSKPKSPGKTTTIGVAPQAQAPAAVQPPVQVVVQVPPPAPVVQQPVAVVQPQPVVQQPVVQQPVVQQPVVQQPVVQQPVAQAQPAPVYVAPQPVVQAPVVQVAPQPMVMQFPEPSVSQQVPPAPQSAPRVRGEELIADLFESMHDLHFQPDAVAAGDFVLGLALGKIPSRAGIVHFYDIDKREFVIGSIAGASPPKLLTRRHPEAEALLNSAMRKRNPIVTAGSDSRVEAAARFVLIGDVAHVMTAPVMLSGRFLGAIELVDPTDGSFDPSDVNALKYIADQFAEYLGQHGVVLDPERISKRTPAS